MMKAVVEQKILPMREKRIMGSLLIVFGITGLFIGMFTGMGDAAIDTLWVGIPGRSWAQAGTGVDVDLTGRLGWLRPRTLGPAENLVPGLAARGGMITMVGTVFPFTTAAFADGDTVTVFWYLFQLNEQRVAYLFDLGGVFGVTRLRVVRPPKGLSKYKFEEALQGITLGVNAGDPRQINARGQPILTSVVSTVTIAADAQGEWAYALTVGQ